MEPTQKLPTKQAPRLKFADRAEMAAYITAALAQANNDSTHVMRCLLEVARSYGVRRLADEAGLSRSNLYRALAEPGDPQWSTIWLLLRALGISLTATPTRFLEERK